MDDHPTIADATAVVLTGGKSSRMGRPKALLPFDGEPLIVHIVRHLKRVFAETVVVAAPEQELPLLPVALVRDQVAYQGPVSGIYRGLKAATMEVCFVTSCDAPFLDLAVDLASPVEDLGLRCGRAVLAGALSTFACCLSTQRRTALARATRARRAAADFLYDKVRTRKVHEDEIRTP